MTTAQKISPCVRCGAEKERGRGKSLCASCRDATVWSSAVPAPRVSLGCVKCGAQKAHGQSLCVECKKSAQKVNRIIKPCSNCGAPKDRTGLGVKLCSSCKADQAQRSMSKVREYRRGSQWSASMNNASAERRKNMAGTSVLRNRTRNSQLKAEYGIDLADYARRLAGQGGVCAICQNVETKLDRRTASKAQSLSVDHDHKTGAVRGLLCSRCNTGIGLFGEDVGKMLKAIMYLEHARSSQTNTAPEAIQA